MKKIILSFVIISSLNTADIEARRENFEDEIANAEHSLREDLYKLNSFGSSLALNYEYNFGQFIRLDDPLINKELVEKVDSFIKLAERVNTATGQRPFRIPFNGHLKGIYINTDTWKLTDEGKKRFKLDSIDQNRIIEFINCCDIENIMHIAQYGIFANASDKHTAIALCKEHLHDASLVDEETAPWCQIIALLETVPHNVFDNTAITSKNFADTNLRNT